MKLRKFTIIYLIVNVMFISIPLLYALITNYQIYGEDIFGGIIVFGLSVYWMFGLAYLHIVFFIVLLILNILKDRTGKVYYIKSGFLYAIAISLNVILLNASFV